MDLNRIYHRLFEAGQKYKIELKASTLYVIFAKGKTGPFSSWKPIGFISNMGNGQVLIVLCRGKMSSHAKPLRDVLEPIDPAKMITIQAMSLDAEKTFHSLFPQKKRSLD